MQEENTQTETETKVRAIGTLVFKVISGSTSFGLNTPTSDIDIRGVYILPWKDRLRQDAPQQIADSTNDETYWEITKFFHELAKANPQALEMLYSSDDCILEGKEFLEKVRSEMDFITMRCEKTFVEYAKGQIARARGLNKKVFNPQAAFQPKVLDYCYVLAIEGRGVAIPFKEWLQTHKDDDYGNDQKWYTLAAIDHIDMGYAIYGQPKSERNVPNLDEHDWRWAYGIVRNEETSGDIQLNSIPKGKPVLGYMVYNKNAYSKACKEHAEFLVWEKKRNPERYETTLAHGQGYDAKNMMHCVRLLHTARDIAMCHKVIVNRRHERDFLLNIKNGGWKYDDILTYAEKLVDEVHVLFANSNLRADDYTVKEIDDYTISVIESVIEPDADMEPFLNS